MASDYIPNRDRDFDPWFQGINRYVAQKCSGGAGAAWKHIPEAARAELDGAYNGWYNAYVKTNGPHTPVDTQVKNTARKAAEQVIRPFVNQYLRYDPVTDADRVAMGIPVKDTQPTPIPPPAAQAEGDLAFPGVHLVEVRNIRAVTGTGDVRSEYGVRIYYGFTGPATVKHQFRLGGAPASGEGLPYSAFTRRKKYLFDFDGESGNTVYFCLRYENPSGQAGPFGPVLQAVIP